MTATAPTLGRYGAFAHIGLRQAALERGAVAGRLLFYGVILLIFARLWHVVQARGALTELTPAELIWYLAITEWIVLSIPLVHLDIEADVRSGDVACQLPRPISYLGAKVAAALGEYGLRAATLGLAGAALAWTLGGGLPRDPRGLVLVVPLGLAAGSVALLFQAAIGLCAFWLQDTSPLYWLWQKLVFVLGGLMLPLEIYPAWLREVALWTPFTAILYGPGSLAFGLDVSRSGALALRLALWGAFAALLLAHVWGRARRSLDINGG